MMTLRRVFHLKHLLISLSVFERGFERAKYLRTSCGSWDTDKHGVDYDHKFFGAEQADEL